MKRWRGCHHGQAVLFMMSLSIVLLSCYLHVIVLGAQSNGYPDGATQMRDYSKFKRPRAWQPSIGTSSNFTMQVSWSGGGPLCSASKCNASIYQEGFAWSNKTNGKWANGTKVFQNKVYSNPKDDFYYRVVGFNLTLYGHFECSNEDRRYNWGRKSNARFDKRTMVMPLYCL